MKPQKYYWKVCTKGEDNSLWSFCAFDESIRVEYKVGKPTFPRFCNSKLFIFKTRKAARNFKNNSLGSHTRVVCKVTAKNVQNIRLLRIPRRSRAQEYWDSIVKANWDEANLPGNLVGGFLPTDTLFCDELTVVERTH